MAYEVFISFKRGKPDGSGLTRDYELASDLHRTLVQMGVNVFFSEKDLSSSAFVREIYRALDQAKIIVIVGTRPEYVESEWVHSEWEFFLAALLGKRKVGGEIYTYLEGMSPIDLPAELFNRQSYDSSQKSQLVSRIMQNLGKSVPKPELKPAPEPKTAPKPEPTPKPEPVRIPVVQTKSPKRISLYVSIAAVLVVLLLGGVGLSSALRNNMGSNKTVPSVSDGDARLSEAVSSGSESSVGSGDVVSSPLESENTDSISSDNVAIGDYITFGSYPQSSNKAEPIEWRVLDVQDGKALVISKRLLDCVSYNEAAISTTWETCTMRQWMNNDFLNAAFSANDQSRIATVTIQNPDNPVYGTNGGNDTQDKIFALSLDEAKQYFPNNTSRIAMVTAYARERGSINFRSTSQDGLYSGWWRLRSPGNGGTSAAYVDGGGEINNVGFYFNSGGGSVRPALWLILS